MCVLFVLIATVALALASPQAQISQSEICKVFECPGEKLPTKPTVISTTIKPIDIPVTSIEPCVCVPYYLCKDGVAIDQNNCTVTGWGVIDLRFNENPCEDSIDKCCTKPKNATELPPPVPIGCGLKRCGYRNPKGLDFTLKGGSGDLALYGEFPWVVELVDALNNSYAGVGVLIHPQVVMTAAHVAARYEVRKLLTRAGEWDRNSAKERLPHQDRLVKEIILHPEFRDGILFNNIALMKLETPVVLADHINVACLPSQDETFADRKKCVTNGWGQDRHSSQSRFSLILKKIDQDMVPHDVCQTKLRRTRLGSHFNLHNSFVCSGGEEGVDTCKGDGGAPLVCPIGDDRYKLTGLIGWGIGCKEKDHPAVSTNVAMFRNWIDNTMISWGYDTSIYNIA